MQFLISVIVFFFLFFFLWDVNLPMLASIKETWIWNKEGAFGTNIPSGGENPILTLNGYHLGKRYYSFAKGAFLPVEEPFRIDFSLLAIGYLEYQKIGDTVNFYSYNGELYWNKPINSYPRSGYFGTPVLYFSGDNNTVFLLDTSGNPAGIGEVNGRFLTDFDFDQSGNGAVILFSGGEIYRVDSKGNLRFRHELSLEKANFFFKSVSLSPDGKLTVVHYSIAKKDYILILNEHGDAEEEWQLQGFFPHKIYFAISNTMNTLLNLPNQYLFFRGSKLTWEGAKLKPGSIYQAVFAFQDGFVYGAEEELIFLDASGELIRRKKLTSADIPFRFFPGKNPSTLYLESRRDTYQLTVFH